MSKNGIYAQFSAGRATKMSIRPNIWKTKILPRTLAHGIR